MWGNKKQASSFRWAVGIEGSFIPHLGIDQYQWTQHDRFWQDDFRRVANEIGARWLRYSFPWHILEPKPGVYDWKWADERIKMAKGLGLSLILNLSHFGTPTWLPEAYGDIEFPAALEAFCQAFGKRYAGSVEAVCPVNEPLITSLFCGDIGLWPPNGRSFTSYMAVLSRVVQGINRSIRVLRQSMPKTEIFICDACEMVKVDESENVGDEIMQAMRADMERRRQRRFLVLDMLMGRVDEKHPLFSWLTDNSFSKMDISWFLRNRVSVDVIGLDYYPHTEVELIGMGDKFGQRVPDKLAGLYQAAMDYWERYHIPLMITETSFCGTDKQRLEWLDFTVADVRKLRADGVPMIGYTWWPMIDHLDWDGALLHQTGYIHPVGVYRLERQANGDLTRVATPLRDSYHEMLSGGDAAVGALSAPAVEAKTAEKETTSLAVARTPEPAPKLEYPIIVHCHLDWEGVWQRPQQFLSRLSRRHRILFVEGPHLVHGKKQPQSRIKSVPEYPNITILQMDFPAALFGHGAWVDSERYRLVREALNGPLAGQFSDPVQWFYDPMATSAFAGKMGEAAIVYDCMDELSKFKFAPPEIAQRERDLLAVADVVFCGGQKIYQAKSKLNGNCHFYGCGVELGHFSSAQDPATVVPPDAGFIYRPILGYFGVVDERLDYRLIEKLAASNPKWSVVMIGPVVKVVPNALPRAVNLYWLGGRPYKQLPSYARAFDVCLMPFALNEHTEYINPTKALEYMATGKPIVSTPVADVVSQFRDVIHIARNHDEFIKACRRMIDQVPEKAVQKGLRLAGESSWETIVEKLEGHVQEALRRKSALAPGGDEARTAWQGAAAEEAL